MKRTGFIALTLLGIAVVVCLNIWFRQPLPKSVSVSDSSASKSAGSGVPAEVKVTETFPATGAPTTNQSIRLVGEVILRDYGNPNLPPQNDLTLMSRLMDNSLLLLKSAANRPLSANEDWADLFAGKNAAHERFLPDKHPALNSRGQLVDRWGTPLFVHAL